MPCTRNRRWVANIWLSEKPNTTKCQIKRAFLGPTGVSRRKNNAKTTLQTRRIGIPIGGWHCKCHTAGHQRRRRSERARRERAKVPRERVKSAARAKVYRWSGGESKFARLVGTDFQVLLAIRPVRTCFSRFPSLFTHFLRPKTAERKNPKKNRNKQKIA